MRIGLHTDAFPERPLEAVLGWLEAELSDVRDLELGAGGYSPAPHLDRAALLADAGARRRLLELLERRGFRLAALNASGNPLEAPAHDRALRETIRLAPLLGVDRVVCMSGGQARLAGGWFPGVEEETERYWRERVLPYWRELAAEARAAEVRLCLELEPGNAAFNVSTFERLAAAGDELAVNLDPSHFFWQAIDPLVALRRLCGRIGHAHAKDAVLADERVEVDGLLDRSTWRYATVGHGHDAGWWAAFASALGAAGYDGVLAIEHEDALVSAEEGVRAGAAMLAVAVAAEVSA